MLRVVSSFIHICFFEISLARLFSSPLLWGDLEMCLSKWLFLDKTCRSLYSVLSQQTLKNIWRAILKYQGILNANNKVISTTAPAQKARSIIISSETSSSSFDVSIFSSFSKCDSVTKTTVHSFTFLRPSTPNIKPSQIVAPRLENKLIPPFGFAIKKGGPRRKSYIMPETIMIKLMLSEAL